MYEVTIEFITLYSIQPLCLQLNISLLFLFLGSGNQQEAAVLHKVEGESGSHTEKVEHGKEVASGG